MKRSLFNILFLLLFPVSGFAQSQQLVLVQEYREKSQKTPLEGVSMTVQNAGSSMSDAQGSMTLQFRTLKAGDAVQVRRVDLSGYEIFNRDAVDQWTISPQKTFNLVLCRSDRFKQLRDQYMRVSSESYERQYKKDQARLAALRKENKLKEEAYQQQLAELEDNYYEQLDNLENYVDRFARIDLSELSSQEQKLIEMVQEGNIEEAVDLYESADYLSQYTTQVKDLQEINKAQHRLAQLEEEKLAARRKVQQAITRQVQTYQLAGGQENFRKISALLKGVADADTTNIDAVWQYGDFCHTNNMFEECEKYLNIYFRQTDNNKTLQIRSCLLLGTMYYSKYQFDLSETYLLKAVELSQNKEEYEPLLIESRINLHTLYIYENKPEAALVFSEQLKSQIEKECTQEVDDNIWHSRLAMLYGEQGKAYYLVNEIEKVEPLLLKCYEMTEGNDELRNLSISYLNEFYYNTRQWQKMEPYMLEDLKIRTDLYNKNPDLEARFLLGSYINLCELYCNLENFSQSHLYLTKAEQMLVEVSSEYDDSSVDFDKMNLYDAASQLYHKEGNQEQASKYAKQCLDSYYQLPDEMKEGLEELVQRNQSYIK